jgi:acyl-coenzyme A thioesterase PaaI-like protein
MAGNGNKEWMRGGAALSLLASAACYAFRRRLPGRLALGLAVAFLERMREDRLAARVHALLARSSADLPGRRA